MDTDNTDKIFPHKKLCYEILGAVYGVRNTYGSGQRN